jgi:hypothetical protein
MSDAVPANEIVDLPEEEWRAYNEDIEVSSVGNVRCAKTKCYRGTSINPETGYRTTPVKVHGKFSNHYVHRLMATAFKLPQTPEQVCVDHINRDRACNRIENLRWATRRENALNARARKTNTGIPYITKTIQTKQRKKNGPGTYEYFTFNCQGAEKSFSSLEAAIAARDAHFQAVGRRI